MSSLRVRIPQVTNKKFQIFALAVVAVIEMVAGVPAANLAITPTTNTGEIGTYHTSTGTMTIVDDGLGVVANSGAASAAATFPANGLNNNVNNALTGGDWFDKITFTDTATDSTAHTATVSIRNEASKTGSLVVSTTFTLTGPGPSSTS